MVFTPIENDRFHQFPRSRHAAGKPRFEDDVLIREFHHVAQQHVAVVGSRAETARSEPPSPRRERNHATPPAGRSTEFPNVAIANGSPFSMSKERNFPHPRSIEKGIRSRARRPGTGEQEMNNTNLIRREAAALSANTTIHYGFVLTEMEAANSSDRAMVILPGQDGLQVSRPSE